MSDEQPERPDPDLPQDPGIPGAKPPEELPPDSSPVEPPPHRSDEDEAAIEEPDQEGQRRLGRDAVDG